MFFLYVLYSLILYLYTDSAISSRDKILENNHGIPFIFCHPLFYLFLPLHRLDLVPGLRCLEVLFHIYFNYIIILNPIFNPTQ